MSTATDSIKSRNAQFFWQPMAHPAESRANPPIILTGGEGVHVTDIDGNRSIDATSGLWNVNLGHSCRPVKEAISAQLEVLPFYSSFRGTTNDKAIELSSRLFDFFKEDGVCRSFFTCGGSDSVEVALKMARQYHRLRGDSGRVKFISLTRGYHGTHFGGASVNGNVKFRNAYEPLMPGCYHIPAPFTYRNPYNETSPEKLATLVAAALEAEIAFQGANTVAAFIMEPVLGAGGVIVPPPEFMPMARKICDDHGVLLIADEVITAFGRTGSPSGSRHWGVQPDMMATAKAITNGYFPFGAVLASEKITEAFESDGTGEAALSTGYTYSGHPVGAAAGLAALDEIERLRPHENAAARGRELLAGLQQLKEKFDIIGDVRGEGLMCALELVEDRESKKPAGKQTMEQVQSTVYENGVMIRVSANLIMISPPLICESSHINTSLSALETGLKAA